jgi:hypothetical protein
VKLALSRGNSAAEAQEASFLHWRTEQPVERLADRHQHGPSSVAQEVQRPHRPRLVELVLQFELVGQTIEAIAGRVVGGRNNDQPTRLPPSPSRQPRRKARRPSPARLESRRPSTLRPAGAAPTVGLSGVRLED